MTLATDYLLGTLSEVCAVLLLKRNSHLRQMSIRLWAFALMAVAMGSYAGGTYHGFRHALEPAVAAVLWKVTTISMGCASFFLLTSALTSAFAGEDRRWLIAGAALKLAIYVVWMLGHDEFRFVIYDYGSTLAILLLLVAAGRTRGVDGHRAYIASGILVSVAAAAVQQSGFRLHEHFNHNDLMHVIQMGGVWLLYEGGARLRDAGGLNGPES
jgi:drug/metabolite transporter (DMT)-like permease